MAAKPNDHAVSDTTDSVTRDGQRTSKFEIPVAIFPAFAIGLVVIGFGVRLLMKVSAARGTQTIDYTGAVTIMPDDDHIRLSDGRSVDEATNFGEDDFESSVCPVSDRRPSTTTPGSIRPTISAREARLVQLFDDIHQRLGWDGSTQWHPPKQKVAS